jgi:hypothetical protein
MLQKLGDHIANCRKRAELAEERAATSTDSMLKADHLAMAKQWLYLARSYEFVESLERFLLDAERHKNVMPPDPPKLD